MEQGTGAVEQPFNEEHYAYDDLIGMSGDVELDWKEGYDIRNEINGEIRIKNQLKTLSCVGQGWSYYVWILNIIELMKKYDIDLTTLRKYHSKKIDEVSAKAIYSQIALENGGAYIGAGGKLIVNWGAVRESIVPSIRSNGKLDEKFVRDLKWKNEIVDELAKILKGKNYRIIRAKNNMELYARAILENKGVVGGVRGNNDSGWGSERPRPASRPTWAHCIYFGAFGTDEKGKFIATPNSWGRKAWNKEWYKGAPAGIGWQKLYTDYINKSHMFDPWTYTDMPNLENMENDFVKIIKDTNSKAVGFWIPMTSPEALKTMALAYNKEIAKNEDSSIDWEKTIEGELTLID